MKPFSNVSSANEFDRYSRQMRFPPIGTNGQARLSKGRVLVVGCGALGSSICNLLVRAGIGMLRIVDRDFAEISNLQRQVLFDENDVARNLPKAIAAAEKLRAINAQVEIEPIVADVEPHNIEALCNGIDLILDGTDNFEIRFLINDVAVKHNLPWIYGGCLGADGQTMTILPGQTACLNCLMLDGPPPPGTTPTCDSAGILSTIIQLIAAIETNEAIKILSGNAASLNRSLTVVSMWDNQFRQLDISNLRDKVNCPTCKQNQFVWLAGKRASQTANLCGRNAVQLSFAEPAPISLPELADRLRLVGPVEVNPFLIKFRHQDYILTIFSDGRAIIQGTEDVAIARKLYSQFVGN
jgi:molybdopterin-synthase adenylyltransferase